MFRRSGQQAKVAAAFALIVLLALALVSLFFYGHARDLVDTDARRTMRDVAQTMSNQLDADIQGLDRIALGMLGNKDFMDAMVQFHLLRGEDEVSLARRRYGIQTLVDKLIFSLNTPILTSPMVSVLIPDRQEFFSWSISGLDLPAINQALALAPWPKKVEALKGAKVLLPPRQNEWTSRGDIVFSVARAIMTTKGQALGILEVQQFYRIMEEACEPAFASFVTVVFDADKQVVYPYPKAGYEEGLAREIGEAGEGAIRLANVQKPFLYAAHVSSYTGWTTVILRPADDVFHAAVLSFRFVLYSMLTVLCLSLLAVFFMAKKLTAPIRKLRSTIEAVDLGNLNLSLEEPMGNDELKRLGRSFEKLIERMDISNRQQVEAQRAEMRAYLLALQSQMNPHFLYNTLNTIVSAADEAGQDVIVSICTDLIQMLRYVSDYERSTATLLDETRHAAQYLSLLKRRFEDALRFSIDVIGDAANITVPKLILQPLVENSYRHGLSRVAQPWRIEVVVIARARNDFEIRVMDNGAGFSEEALAHVMGDIAAFRAGEGTVRDALRGERPHVGLLNTLSRLYLVFGEAVFLIVEKNEPGACVVVVRVATGEEDA